MKLFTLFLSLTLSPLAHADDLAQAAADIPEFHQVTDGIYRGGHPGTAGLADLQKLGVKTILDLENDDDEIAAERTDTAPLSLGFLSEPMSGFWAPEDSEADDILRLMADPANQPLFIHCTYGQDRTGLMVGLYKVANGLSTPADAYSEMLAYGFKNNLLFPLDNFFRARTGL